MPAHLVVAIWAQFKPCTVAVTRTHGADDDLRCFVVDYLIKEEDSRVNKARRTRYLIEGHYLQHDGKKFGHSDFEVAIDSFKGTREIAKLAAYTLENCRDAAAVRSSLLARGKRFVALRSINIHCYEDIALVRQDEVISKLPVNGRIVLDPLGYQNYNPDPATWVEV